MSLKEPFVKIVVIGDANVGKTSLIHYCCSQVFLTNTNMLSLPANKLKKIHINGKEVLFTIWDTAGQERFAILNRHFYTKSYAAILCHDLTESYNFKGTIARLNDLRKYVNCRVYVCGTKKDLVNNTSELQKTVRDLTSQVDADTVYETSSKTGENIDLLFRTIAEDYLKDSEEDPDKFKKDQCAINLETPITKRKTPNKTHCCS